MVIPGSDNILTVKSNYLKPVTLAQLNNLMIITTCYNFVATTQ